MTVATHDETSLSAAQRRLSRRFVIYKFFLNLCFTGSIWLYFYRLFMNDAQVGLLDGLAFAIGLVAEIPSGALADKFGRNRVAKIGALLAAVGIGMQIFGGFAQILIWQSVLTIGFALISGADEALFFEKLQFREQSLHWRKLMTRVGQATAVASVVALPVGGWLYQINPRLPFVLTAAAFAIAAALIWRVRDTPPPKIVAKTAQPTPAARRNFRDYFSNIQTGFRLFASPKLRLYVPLILAVSGLLYCFSWGILRVILLDRFHFSAGFGSIVLAAGSVFAVAVLWLINKFAAKLSEKLALTIISFSICLSLIAAMFDIRLFGIAVIFILYAGDGVMSPFISEILNKRAPDVSRSTVLSFANFLRVLPYVALAPLIGWLNSRGSLGIFLLGMALLIVAAWLYYISRKRRDDIIATRFD